MATCLINNQIYFETKVEFEMYKMISMLHSHLQTVSCEAQIIFLMLYIFYQTFVSDVTVYSPPSLCYARLTSETLTVVSVHNRVLKTGLLIHPVSQDKNFEAGKLYFLSQLNKLQTLFSFL